MKLAAARPTTQTERIFALEEARKADGERMTAMELKVTEMHEILVSVRTLGRGLRGLVYYAGGPSAVGAAAIYGWHLLKGL